MCDIYEDDQAEWPPEVLAREAERLAQLARNAARLERSQPEHVLYSGPRDGLASPFCAVLAGHMVPYAFLKGLTNGRGRPVLDDAGGFRCRFSIEEILPETAEAVGIPHASAEQLEEAARVASRLRRQHELRGLK